MRPLETNRCVLTWFSIYPPATNTSQWKRWVYISFTAFDLIILLLAVVSASAFVRKFVSIKLEASLMALMDLVGCITMSYVIIVTCYQRQEFLIIFDSLTKIYDERKIYRFLHLYTWNFIVFFYFAEKNRKSFKYLERVNNMSETMWSIFFKFEIFAAIGLNIVLGIFSVWLSWHMNGHFDSENTYHMFNLL